MTLSRRSLDFLRIEDLWRSSSKSCVLETMDCLVEIVSLRSPYADRNDERVWYGAKLVVKEAL